MIMYKKKAGFDFFDKLKGKKWFHYLLLASIIIMIISMVGFYYFVGQIALTRVSGTEEAGGGLVPLIPGITLRGTTLLYVLFSVGIAATIHELSHAAAAKHVGVPVKSTGVILALFIPAAFVEPDEESFKKTSLLNKAKILAAGPASNVFLGIIFMLMLTGMVAGMTGAEIIQVEHDSPAEKAGLQPGMIIIMINGSEIKSLDDVGKVLSPYKTSSAVFNFTVQVGSSGEIKNILVEKPANRSLIGITMRVPKAIPTLPDWLYYPVFNVIIYGYIINLSLAIINAAPIFISDGGRLLSELFQEKIGGIKGRTINFFIQIISLLLIIFSITFIPI